MKCVRERQANLTTVVCPVESRVEKSAVGKGFAIGYVGSRIEEAQAPCLRFAVTVWSKPTQAGEGRQLVAGVSLPSGLVFPGNSEMILVFALWQLDSLCGASAATSPRPEAWVELCYSPLANKTQPAALGSCWTTDTQQLQSYIHGNLPARDAQYSKTCGVLNGYADGVRGWWCYDASDG